MRGRLRALGAPGVQARTFHSAALRQLRYFWPHVHGTELPTLIESKIGLLATAARRQRLQRRPGAAARPRLRGRVGQGQQRPPRRLRADRRAARPQRCPGTTPRRWPGSSPAYEEVKRGQGRMDMEDVLLLTAGMLAEDERVAAQVRRQYKWFVVDEFQDVSPLQSALLDLWLGGRDELCVVGDPAQTIYSFAGANADYLRDFPTQVPRHHLGRAGPQLPLHPGGGRPRPTPCSPAPPAQVSSCGPSAPPGPAVTYTPRPDEVAEAEAVGRADRCGCATRGRSLGEVAVLFRINAQSEAFEEALAARGTAVRRPRRRPLLRPARGPRGRDPAARRRPVRGGARQLALGRRGPRHPRRAWAGPPQAPTTRGQTRDRWESWQALVDQAAEFATAAPGHDLNASSTTSTAAPPSSTRRSPTASPWPPSTPPRAWSGTRSSSAACRTARCRSPTPRRPAAIEEERRLLYVGMTRARLDLALSWALARNPGGRASRKPSRFLDPPAARRRPVAPRRAAAAARSPAAASAASRCRPARRRSAAAARTARRRTTRSCSSGCASGARSGRARRACRRSSCSPTPPCS